MPVSRRKFIQMGSLASASLMIPKFLKGFEFSAPGAAGNNKVLIVVQLTGGNDGLNTIIPYRNDVYYKNRPSINIAQNQVLNLSGDVGINPNLKGIKSLYDQGYVSIINGVGYENPNRSHFRSMDIWHSASNAQDVVNTGWLGRYMENAGAAYNKYNSIGIELDETLGLAMKGETMNGISFQDIERFHITANDPFFGKIANMHAQEHGEKLADYLYKTLRETNSAAEYIYSQSKIYNTAQTYPNTPIGKAMKLIGSLVMANSETRVYYVSHGSFDTHVNQVARQNKLFGQLDDALTALVSDLKKNNRFDDTMVMTFSEFGRRVEQNASNGTDHGTANNMFFISGGLKKSGLYNNLPDLGNLDEGDLKFDIDFKQVYATVLDKWMAANPATILKANYSPLTFI